MSTDTKIAFSGLTSAPARLGDLPTLPDGVLVEDVAISFSRGRVVTTVAFRDLATDEPGTLMVQETGGSYEHNFTVDEPAEADVLVEWAMEAHEQIQAAVDDAMTDLVITTGLADRIVDAITA